MSVAALEDIEVAARAAGKIVVALAGPQHVGRARPDQRIVVEAGRALLVDDLHRHAEAVPHDAVGEDDRVDAGVELLAAGEIVVELAQELVAQPDGPRAAVELEDQVLALAARPDVARQDVGETQLVGVAGVPVVDDVVA